MVDAYIIVIRTVLDADKENFCAAGQPLPRRQVQYSFMLSLQPYDLILA